MLASEQEDESTDQPPPAEPPPPPPGSRRFGRDLTTGSIPRHLVMFSLPMLAGSAFQTAYSFINAIWVGQYIGKTALAAVTVSFPVVFVLFAVAAGLTMATNILISQHYGAGDMPAVRRVVNSSTLLIGVLSLMLCLGGELAAPMILRAMDTSPEVMDMAVKYLRIFLLSLPLGFGLFLTRSMLQGIGDSITPLYFLAGSVILNAVLDPLLMFGYVGLPPLGLNGTAYATIIAQTLALSGLIYWLHKKGNPVAPTPGRAGFDWPTTWATIRIGVPSAVQQSLISIGMVFVTGIINGFGPDATAAFGAASRVDQVAFLPAMTFSLAISALTGQNIGANRHHRVREIFLWGCLFSGGITLICSVLAISLPGMLLRIFNADPAVIGMGESYLRIVGASYLFFAIMFVSNGVINGAGHTLFTMLISLVSLWVVRVPTAEVLSRKIGITGVWYAIGLSFGVSMCVSLVYYFSGRWRRPVRHGRPTPPTPDAVFGEETGEA